MSSVNSSQDSPCSIVGLIYAPNYYCASSYSFVPFVNNNIKLFYRAQIFIVSKLSKLLESQSRILIYELGYSRGVKERLRGGLSEALSVKRGT